MVFGLDFFILTRHLFCPCPKTLSMQCMPAADGFVLILENDRVLDYRITSVRFNWKSLFFKINKAFILAWDSC